VTLTAVDIHGNENTATAIVTIEGDIPQSGITVSRDNHVYTGLPNTTIAIGYGAQSFQFSAAENPSGGINYSWTPSSGLSSTNGRSTVFTPTEEGTFTFAVEVTNQYGCSSISDVIVQVIDVRCGNKNNKVKVCHTVGRHAVESCVASSAVPAMLLTGGKLGPCSADENPTDPTSESVLAAYPNPFESVLNLQFKLPVSDGNVRLVISDLLGRSVTTAYHGPTESGQVHSFSLDADDFRGRVFVVRLITSTGKVYYLSVLKK
jgi:hypothetical protein